ncbi:ankyrin repeat domain-containing protein [Acetobacter musti]|uniref:Ankyrin repeat domain-containing protein n=1 Tax=Acetobacter musti TaxID=864732 RepID=A0ABX0JQ09_9PROT|nr:ankyrin repeat domain-containing protein [Acetobacter musti]NHN85538.1 ankyrin repeat domain-containing protein [Acetobacter musti]
MSHRRSVLKRRFGIHLSLSALLLGIAAGSAPLRHAHAQEQDADQAEAEAEAEEAAKKAEERRAAKRAAPPAALPGAQSNEEEGGHSNMDLEPTSALFDAINRGSLSAAREAVNRGADLNGHNVLSQTPLDMAIDLNRNDIMFFLLSMRSLEAPDETTTSVASSGVSMEGGSGHLSVGGRASRGGKIVDSRYDASGGRPQPSVGFLGFGGT